MPGNLGKLGEARVDVTADTSKLKSGLSGAQKMLAGVAAAMAAVTAASRLMSEAWGKAKIQTEAVTQLEARLKSTKMAAGLTADEIRGFAAELQGMTKHGDEATIAMSNILLTFTKIKGPVFKDATVAILNISDALGQGLQQTAIQVGKALQDPIQGVTALRRVGIQLSDEQTRQIKRFVELNDVASAQNVILGELNTQFGGTAEALRKTPFGEADALSNTFGDTLEIVGGVLGKVFKPAIVGLNSELSKFNALLAGSSSGMIEIMGMDSVKQMIKSLELISTDEIGKLGKKLPGLPIHKINTRLQGY